MISRVTSLSWLPNVGLALVAVSVDPPLSQQDIELLKNLYRYTPNVSILLTKVDLLGIDERSEVVDFIRTRLTMNFGRSPEILPYSVRPGYEGLREQLEQKVVGRTLNEFGGHSAQSSRARSIRCWENAPITWRCTSNQPSCSIPSAKR